MTWLLKEFEGVLWVVAFFIGAYMLCSLIASHYEPSIESCRAKGGTFYRGAGIDHCVKVIE